MDGPQGVMTPELESAAGRPLVTFALFAYNQEKYIREAVEGAFAQTYEPLEIILSDDYSSDRTFKIMQEMAAQYVGSHRVRIRQSEVNFGTAQHVYAVSLIAKGTLLIVAAGDDVSYPRRCETIVEYWNLHGSPISCIHSAANLFSDNFGERFLKARTNTMSDVKQCIDMLLRDELPFNSPTCAYSLDLFRAYQPLIGGSIIEDGVMAVRSLLSYKVISIQIPLVRMRVSSETAGTGYSIDNKSRWNRFMFSRIVSYMTIMRDVSESKIDRQIIYKLENMYIKKIFAITKFIIPNETKLSGVWRIKFLFRYLFFYPTSAKVTNKVVNVFSIIGYSKLYAFRVVVTLYKRFR